MRRGTGSALRPRCRDLRPAGLAATAIASNEGCHQSPTQLPEAGVSWWANRPGLASLHCVRRPFRGCLSMTKDQKQSHETKPSSPATSLSLCEALLSSFPSGHTVPCPHVPHPGPSEVPWRLTSFPNAASYVTHVGGPHSLVAPPHAGVLSATWPTGKGAPVSVAGGVCHAKIGHADHVTPLWLPMNPFTVLTLLPPLGFPYPLGSLSGRPVPLPHFRI